jgi:hypothetical protein
LIFRHPALSRIYLLSAKPTCSFGQNVMQTMLRLLVGFFYCSALQLAGVSGGSGQQRGEQAMATKSKTTSNRPVDSVITPAGPRQREKVHEVKPGEVVRRSTDGSLRIEPDRTLKGTETPSPKPVKNTL